MAAGENTYPEAVFDTAIACMIFGRALSNSGVANQALPILQDAQQRFERIGQSPHAIRSAAWALLEQGGSLRMLGRPDQAAIAYKDSIKLAASLGDKHLTAVAKSQLGSVHNDQQRYGDALLAYGEAREIFQALDDLYNLTAILQLTGLVFAETGHYEEAEHSYLESLALMAQLADKGGGAVNYGALGNLYILMNRFEDAVASFRQAMHNFAQIGDIFKENAARSILAWSLFKLGRTADARDQIFQAIQCNETFGHAAQPWKDWNTLRAIETSDGNTQAAEDAQRKALELFLAYRREGGENHQASGLLCAAIAPALLTQDSDGAQKLIGEELQKADRDNENGSLAFFNTLNAIAADQRDTALADNPDLSYDQAVEIILLLETLRAAE